MGLHADLPAFLGRVERDKLGDVVEAIVRRCGKAFVSRCPDRHGAVGVRLCDQLRRHARLQQRPALLANRGALAMAAGGFVRGQYGNAKEGALQLLNNRYVKWGAPVTAAAVLPRNSRRESEMIFLLDGFMFSLGEYLSLRFQAGNIIFFAPHLLALFA